MNTDYHAARECKCCVLHNNSNTFSSSSIPEKHLQMSVLKPLYVHLVLPAHVVCYTNSIIRPLICWQHGTQYIDRWANLHKTLRKYNALHISSGFFNLSSRHHCPTLFDPQISDETISEDDFALFKPHFCNHITSFFQQGQSEYLASFCSVKL